MPRPTGARAGSGEQGCTGPRPRRSPRVGARIEKLPSSNCSSRSTSPAPSLTKRIVCLKIAYMKETEGKSALLEEKMKLNIVRFTKLIATAIVITACCIAAQAQAKIDLSSFDRLAAKAVDK